MGKLKRATVRHSVQDVIRMLEAAPIRRDMVPEINVVQAMNRLNLAHLSIEKTMKFLISEAGTSADWIHNLSRLYRELHKHDLPAAESLEYAFQATVQHYQYNPNAKNMTHLKSLETYLQATGSKANFNDIRYWELDQSFDGALLWNIHLSVHTELLHGLGEILLRRGNTIHTVTDRVDRVIGEALKPRPSIGQSMGTYIEWLQEHESYRAALVNAVMAGCNIGDDYANNIANTAYEKLLRSPDPAVGYFAHTIDVLPRQQRDTIPEVEWLGPERELRGQVNTPGGEVLGFIDRALDGLWHITPLADRSSGRTTPKARTQTDARCYLANLLTRTATVISGSRKNTLRLVGESCNIYGYQGPDTDDCHQQRYDVTFWDENHGIEEGEAITIEPQPEEGERSTERLEGTVTKVSGPKVLISGMTCWQIP